LDGIVGKILTIVLG